jgi:DedD protein
VPATAAKPDEGARAAALLDGQTPAAAGYAIQAGSYTDKAKLQEVVAKLEKAGLAHYTQGAISKNGTHHTRIRLGPFATQQEANAVAIKVNKLGLKTIVIKPS